MMRALKTILPACAGLLILTIAPIAAQADQVTNGSFEAPPLGSNSESFFSTGSSGLTGWTIAGGLGVTLLHNTPAYDGVQSLAMDNLATTNSISQNFGTITGQTYTFSIAYKSGEQDKFTSGAANVKDGSTDLLLRTLSTTSTDWVTYSNTFTALSASTTITVTGSYVLGSTQAHLLVDAVSVKLNAVPEPGSLALGSLAGVGLAAFGRKRLRQIRAAA